jgi:FlaA1/EpsC-like NDP-sugar epimerase
MQEIHDFSIPFPSTRRSLVLSSGGTLWRRIFTSPYEVADLVIALFGVIAAFILTNLGSVPAHAADFLALRVSVKSLLLLVLFAGTWSICFRAFGLYRRESERMNVETVVRLMAASAAGSSMALLFVVTSRAGAFGHGTTLVFWLLAVFSAIAVRVVLNAMNNRAR